MSIFFNFLGNYDFQMGLAQGNVPLGVSWFQLKKFLTF